MIDGSKHLCHHVLMKQFETPYDDNVKTRTPLTSTTWIGKYRDKTLCRVTVSLTKISMYSFTPPPGFGTFQSTAWGYPLLNERGTSEAKEIQKEIIRFHSYLQGLNMRGKPISHDRNQLGMDFVLVLLVVLSPNLDHRFCADQERNITHSLEFIELDQYYGLFWT